MGNIHSLNTNQIRQLARKNKNNVSMTVVREQKKRGIVRKRNPPVVYVSRFKDPKIRSVGSNRLFKIMKQRPYTDY